MKSRRYTVIVFLLFASCSATTQYPPMLTSSFWDQQYLVPKKVSLCPSTKILRNAQEWVGQKPPSSMYGKTSFSYMNHILQKSCSLPLTTFQQVQQIKQLQSADIVVIGSEAGSLISMVEGCNAQGTCHLITRTKTGVTHLRVNTMYPHQHRNKFGDIINSTIQVITLKKKKVVTTAEAILSIHRSQLVRAIKTPNNAVAKIE